MTWIDGLIILIVVFSMTIAATGFYTQGMDCVIDIVNTRQKLLNKKARLYRKGLQVDWMG